MANPWALKWTGMDSINGLSIGFKLKILALLQSRLAVTNSITLNTQ